MSVSCLDLWLALALAALANGALLYCGHVASRRFWPDARASVRLAAAAVIALALALLVFYALALAGLFTRRAAVACALALGVGARAAWGKWSGIGRDARAFAEWWRRVVGSRGAVLLLGIGVLLMFAGIRAATRPPLTWDGLVYHDYFAGQWVQSGRLVHPELPAAVGSGRFPIHAEALVAWVMLPFHGDFLANFVNFPVLALVALSVYALCREMDVCVLDSSLAAGLVGASPALLGYVTTQHSDVLVAAALCGSALFATRFVAGGAWRDAALAFVASAIALGTKYLAIPAAAVLCLVVIAAAARGRHRVRRLAAAVALGAALLVVLGGYRYVRNWLEVGNPIYPTSIRILGTDIFPRGRPFTQAIERMGRGSWRDDAEQLGMSMAYMYGARPTPLSWGPKLPALLVLALLALWLARRAPWRARLWCLTAAWAVPVVLFYAGASEEVVVVRRFWREYSFRFLATPVALMAVGAFAAVSLLPAARVRGAARVALCGLLLYDVCVMVILPDAYAELAVLGCALPVVVAAGLAAAWAWGRSRSARVALGALGVAVALLGAAGVELVRDGWRHRFFETREDLGSFPRDYAKGWAFCDEPSERRTIALVSYEPEYGNHWFFYPLMGRRLQNRALYVPAEESSAWLEGLRAAGATHVFVQLDPALPADDPRAAPAELAWITGRPEAFVLVDAGLRYRVYRVCRPTGVPGGGRG